MVNTRGRGTYEISRQVQSFVSSAGISTGLCNIFTHHTSASLIICENADPSVRRDLETIMLRLAPDGDAMYEHADEGPDDMPAHIRSILTLPSVTVPVAQGRALLGTWQGVYLWEHRYSGHNRKVTLTIYGE